MDIFGVNDNQSLVEADSYKTKVNKGINSDAMFKEVFSNKKVTVYLLALAVPEFKGLEVNHVINCINDAIDPKELEKNPLKLNVAPTESGTGSDKVIRFDVLFKINDRTKMVTILIDLEMQNIVKDSTLKYNIFNRITYYSTRLISNQLTTINSNLNYDFIDKTYTIWIIGDKQKLFKDDSFAVHNFSIKENDNKTESPFDLLNIITIELSKLNESEAELFDYLKPLFDLNKDKLTKYFTESELFGMSNEWNFGEECRKEGLEKGLEAGLKKGLEKGREEGREETKKVFKLSMRGISKEEIADMCNISIEEVESILE